MAAGGAGRGTAQPGLHVPVTREADVASSWILSLAEGIAVSDGDEGEILFSDSYSRLVQRRLSPALSDALRRLASPGETAERLAESVFTAEGSGVSPGGTTPCNIWPAVASFTSPSPPTGTASPRSSPSPPRSRSPAPPRCPTALTACRGSPICTGTERKRRWNHRWPSRGSFCMTTGRRRWSMP